MKDVLRNFFEGKTLIAFLLAGLSSVFFIVILSSNDSRFAVNDIPELMVDMKVCSTDDRKASLELSYLDDSYDDYEGERLLINRNYVYLWISVTNRGELDRQVMLTNQTRNYYVELLESRARGAVTLFKQGDIVPVSSSPVSHYKTAFPLVIPSGSTKHFILEYHGPRGIVIDPSISLPETWMSSLAFERSLAGFVCGALLLLFLLNLIQGLIFWKKYFLGTALFILTNSFFFLRQSRILLLFVDPFFYPEWLFPLSIFFNIAGSILFTFSIMEEHLLFWTRPSLKIIIGLTFILTCFSFFVYPYAIADTLNLIALFALGIILLELFQSIRKNNQEMFSILVSFIPWITMILTDIFSGYLGLRVTLLGEYRQVFGLLVTLFLLTLFFGVQSKKNADKDLFLAEEKIKKIRSEVDKERTSLVVLRTSILHQLSYQLGHPLDMIIASVEILENEYSDARISALCQVIRKESNGLKLQIENKMNSLNSVHLSFEREDPSDDDFSVVLPQKIEAKTNINICIYDSNHQNAKRTSFILQSKGFGVVIHDHSYQVLSTIAKGRVDALIIEPISIGENAFFVCNQIRIDQNMMDFPILMITDYNANYLMKKGYASGVNDFLTLPFDASELIGRVQSMIKLKKIAQHNKELVMSENEKNIFLYFLTHNINTPLTLLLNRVKELEDSVSQEDLPEIIDDLQATSREISDIVQNVLISFRLSDGRHTVRLDEIELSPILSLIKRDLTKRANAKNQDLNFLMPQDLPPLLGEGVSVRGIIYNLVDNAIKFCPEGGMIQLDTVYDEAENKVHVQVSDNGPGISPQEQLKLFQRFERLSSQPTAGESSTGLGLYVAHELAIMNGGELKYLPSSAGACFELTLGEYQTKDAYAVTF